MIGPLRAGSGHVLLATDERDDTAGLLTLEDAFGRLAGPPEST